jgi:hypothetical protein
MLRTSLDQPRPADPAVTRRSDDELRRMREETMSLLTVAIKETAARLVPAQRPDERRALLEGVQQELGEVRAAFASRSPEEMRADARFVLDALRLFRVCPRAGCRKAQTCRGNPERCDATARVPPKAADWAARLLLADRVPWVPLFAETREIEQTAYECWIAGIEAGRE